MHQEGLKKGVLVTWTKSFKCSDGVGLDAVQLLEEAIARRGVSNNWPRLILFQHVLIGFFSFEFSNETIAVIITI